jgi:magnesium chelatase family protein
MVEATPVSYGELAPTAPKAPEKSATVKARVEGARARQSARFAGASVRFNAKMPAALVKKHCRLEREASDLLRQVFESMSMSARAYHKILKIARTIADLSDMPDITVEHIAEAVAYRGLDRKYW